jgi:hypothetical protein
MTARGGVADRARTMVERGLVPGTLFMNARGLLHFDAHLGNILTDDKRLCFADYDLAISSGLELLPDPRRVDRHRSYDRCYTHTPGELAGHRLVRFGRDEREAVPPELAQRRPRRPTK